MPLSDEAGIASAMFVSTLDLTGEVAVDRLTGDGEFIARAAIGYDDVEPPLVSMVTQVAHLPPAALTKYHQICAIFAGKGYRAGRSDSWNGQHTWMMERA